MNENIDLTKILKNCPKGFRLYSLLHGEVSFRGIDENSDYPITYDYPVMGCIGESVSAFYLTRNGAYSSNYNGDCILFPSKDQRDWSKFTAPWYKKAIIAWLKKQCKNSINKIEPRFKVGDWVVNKIGDSWHIDGLDKKNYQVSNGKGNCNYFPISKQDEMHIWTMQDAKDGDVICYRNEISLYKNEIENCNKQDTTFGGFIYYCCYDGKRFITNSFYLLTGQDEIDIYPATKEQRDSLMKAMNNAGYKWNTEKKELKKREKFDPKTLKPFDKVLVKRAGKEDSWTCNIFSSYSEGTGYDFECLDDVYEICVPYNDDTKHLVGTTEEVPEYYRYWED